MSDLFDEPGAGDLFSNKENEGRLLLVTPTEYMAEFTTSAGVGPAVKADVVVLDGPESPKVYQDALLFGKVLTGQLKRNAGTGRPNLGRLGLGVKKPGQNAPWQLAAPGEDDKQVAREYLTKNEEMPF